MTTSSGVDYATARSKFVQTAAFAKADVAWFRHELLGPRPIIHRRRDDPGFERTRSWIGAGATSLYGGASLSSEVFGDGLSAIPGLLPHAIVDAISLECGVRPMDEVGAGLRADAWLHAHGDPTSPEAALIKALIRNAFHSDDPTWQGMALGQGLAACRAVVAGLTLPTASFGT